MTMTGPLNGTLHPQWKIAATSWVGEQPLVIAKLSPPMQKYEARKLNALFCFVGLSLKLSTELGSRVPTSDLESNFNISFSPTVFDHQYLKKKARDRTGTSPDSRQNSPGLEATQDLVVKQSARKQENKELISYMKSERKSRDQARNISGYESRKNVGDRILFVGDKVGKLEEGQATIVTEREYFGDQLDQMQRIREIQRRRDEEHHKEALILSGGMELGPPLANSTIDRTLVTVKRKKPANSAAKLREQQKKEMTKLYRQRLGDLMLKVGELSKQPSSRLPKAKDTVKAELYKQMERAKENIEALEDNLETAATADEKLIEIEAAQLQAATQASMGKEAAVEIDHQILHQSKEVLDHFTRTENATVVALAALDRIIEEEFETDAFPDSDSEENQNSDDEITFAPQRCTTMCPSNCLLHPKKNPLNLELGEEILIKREVSSSHGNDASLSPSTADSQLSERSKMHKEHLKKAHNANIWKDPKKMTNDEFHDAAKEGHHPGWPDTGKDPPLEKVGATNQSATTTTVKESSLRAQPTSSVSSTGSGKNKKPLQAAGGEKAVGDVGMVTRAKAAAAAAEEKSGRSSSSEKTLITHIDTARQNR